MLSLLPLLLLACKPPEPIEVVADCESQDAETVRECVDAEHYQELLERLAVERPPGSAGWRQSRQLCVDQLEAAGFAVEEQDYGSGINVIGTREGTGSEEGVVFLGAHYDHIANCTGADDNASGVAGALEIARILGGFDWSRDLIIACLDEEEFGLRGSDAWADEAEDAGVEVAASIHFDMIGFIDDRPDTQEFPEGFEWIFPSQIGQITDNDNRADFVTLIADRDGSSPVYERFEVHAEAVSLPNIVLDLGPLQMESDLLEDLRRMDHAMFWEEDFPSIGIGDTAEFRYPAYHCRDGDDVVENLNQEFAAKVIAATAATLAEQLED